MKGTLYLLPNLLDKEGDHTLLLPRSVELAVEKIVGIIAESEKEARSYLKRFRKDFREIPIALLNEHTQEIDSLIEPLKRGETWGLISDAGLPIIADPGYQMVKRCRELEMNIEAFTGPSALVFALLLSGLPAQRFAFHGYLSKGDECPLHIARLEKWGRDQRQTQVCIEAPYRSDKLLATLIDTLSAHVILSVAWDLTFPTQGVETHLVRQWRERKPPDIRKKPAVFLFYSG